MTDKFTIFNMGLNGSFIKENGKIMDIKRVVDLLNENEQLKQGLNDDLELIGQLQEENKQLKQENKKLQGKYDHILWLYNGLGCEYDWLKDENQQLKQYKQSVNNVLRSWSTKKFNCKTITSNIGNYGRIKCYR